MKIYQDIYNFKTKNKEGFVKDEIEKLLEKYSNINKEKFNDALCGITCIKIDDEFVIYHCDIEKALRCGIENRNLHGYEFD